MKGNTLYLAYQNNESKSWAIKMLIREAGRWSAEPVVISQTEANCYSPGLAFSREDELIVTWYDTRDGKTRIFSRRFDMLKGSLLDEQRISTRDEAAQSPRVVTSGSKAVVFWESGNRIESKYTDVYVAPPRVVSQTHPDGVWTRNSTARIEWAPPEDESGIVGYASIVTRPTEEGIMPDVNPTVQNYSAVTRRVVLPELTDGITYFHIRAIDGAGNMSRTIHYRIQVSAHPMPMPVVVSPTHPRGKSEKDTAPRLVWSVDDLERLKGFVYSLSKDYVTTPRTFTQDFEAVFSGLEAGNYFFSISAIDKTDQMSQMADYFLTVGNPGKISPEEMLEKLKHRDVPDNRNIAVIRRPAPPAIQITLPFDASKPLAENSFRGLLVARNISAKRMEGYSFYIGSIDREASMTVTQKENIISVDDLKSGEYYISARGQYRLTEGGIGRLVWTDPVKLRLSVKIPDYLSPVQHYGLSILQRFSPRAAAVTIFIMGMSVLTIAMGFGGRLAFYGRLLRYKAMAMAHLLF
jgi:hypothetical protein